MQYINITNRVINRDLIAELYNLASDDDYQLSIELNNNSFILDIWDHAVYLKHDFTTVFRYARDDKEIITAPVSKYIKNYNKLLATLVAYCIELYEDMSYYK